MKKRFLLILLGLVFLMIIGLVIFYPRTKYLPAKIEKLSRGVVTEAIAYRKEKTLFASTDGFLEQLVLEGERVPANTVVALCGTTPVLAEKAGTISWNYDGLEEVVGPGVLMGLKNEYLGDWDKPNRQSQTGKSYFKGEPIGKLVDNYAWFLLAFTDLEAKKGEELSIYINDVYYKGKVLEVLTDKRLNIQINTYSKEASSYRVLRKVEIYKEDLRGVIVPESLLIEKEEGTYLTLIFKNRQKQQPIRVIGRWQGKVVVDGIPKGAKIVLPPR